jgi:pimeloyl-ACP methyl ester carboxylesterase
VADDAKETDSLLNTRSIINGVCGDHLLKRANPLAISMKVLPEPSARQGTQNRYALFVHGLCLNESHWRADAHVELVRSLGYTPIYLRYNSGLSIERNGVELAEQLRALTSGIDTLIIVAHSMGGLLVRIALQVLIAEKHPVLRRISKVFYLGTPHSGAPLEQAGTWVHAIWKNVPFAAALAPIAALRSQGILDLGLGLREQKPVAKSAARRGAPVEYVVAANLSKVGRKSAWLGDGLVPVNSALGVESFAPAQISADRQAVLLGLGHIDLLHAPAVTQQLKSWLAND